MKRALYLTFLAALFIVPIVFFAGLAFWYKRRCIAQVITWKRKMQSSPK
jgi:hypothetical protein